MLHGAWFQLMSGCFIYDRMRGKLSWDVVYLWPELEVS